MSAVGGDDDDDDRALQKRRRRREEAEKRKRGRAGGVNALFCRRRHCYVLAKGGKGRGESFHIRHC